MRSGNQDQKLTNQSWSRVCRPAAVTMLSITRKLGSNGQTRQRWSNMNQYSVTVMPISRLKCFQKHLVMYCLAVKWESLWPGSHVEISWGNTKHRPPAGAQPIGTLSRNSLSLKWPVIGQSLPSRARFFKAWKQSHEEVQKSSFLSEHLNYNMLKGYYGIFSLCKMSAYWSYKCAFLIICSFCLWFTHTSFLYFLFLLFFSFFPFPCFCHT